MSLTSLSLTQMRQGLLQGDFSACDLVQAHGELIKSSSALNAFVTPTLERAHKEASESDARRKTKTQRGPLEGLPLGVKDLFCTQGTRTTACSHILGNFTPPYESTVTKNSGQQVLFSWAS